MERLPRLLILASILLLVPLYFLPIWKINIDAPQFPEGISMHIYINEIGGNEPNTLDNINILNHYIGMREIVPDDIPELKYMPVILAILLGIGLLAVVLNKRWLYYSWITLMIVAVAIAFYDFYLWEYDYGHNLDPTAPIKVPGMSYQPPLLGQKTMLNITATSLPHTGGWLAIGSFLLMAISLFVNYRYNKRQRKNT